MLYETSAHRILAEVFPFFREGFIGSQQTIETAFLPSPIYSASFWRSWPAIRSAIRLVEPALKPFCEITDGRIPVCWHCENVQVIWHRNREQNSPLIELLEHRTAYIPRLSIGQDWLPSLDTNKSCASPRAASLESAVRIHYIAVSQRQPTNHSQR